MKWSEMTARERDAYDQGYEDGESSAHADWAFALNEIGDMPDDFDYTPTKVAQYVVALRANGVDP